MKNNVIKLADKKFCQGCPLLFWNSAIWSTYSLKIGDFRVIENTCGLGYRINRIVDAKKDKSKLNTILRDKDCIKDKWTLSLQ